MFHTFCLEEKKTVFLPCYSRLPNTCGPFLERFQRLTESGGFQTSFWEESQRLKQSNQRNDQHDVSLFGVLRLRYTKVKLHLREVLFVLCSGPLD